MTAKSRQRKIRKSAKPSLETFYFHTNNKTMAVRAVDRETAETIFKAAHSSDIQE